MNDGPKVLVPYDRREAISLAQAAKVCGKSQSTVRGWCSRYWIGRRVVGGKWEVSRAALQMLLDGNNAALEAYLSGDRKGPLVARYFDAIGDELAA